MTKPHKVYQTPQVKRLGTYQELTQQANAQNSDMPNGNADTAYPVAS
ncbi:MAG TPA: hypothetical protein VGE02_14005 [Gemmatimonadales bacterium]